MDGQQQFANAVVDTTLDTLRDQEDQQGVEDASGSIPFNPQIFGRIENPTWIQAREGMSRDMFEKTSGELKTMERRHIVLGPYEFNKKFDAPPTVTFGQSPDRVASSGELLQQQLATMGDYIPLLVQPYVYQFKWTNGAVDGFYVGLYAITSPPKDSVSHIVYWRATGSASRYNEQNTAEAWSEPSAPDSTDFLEDTPYESDNATDVDWTTIPDIPAAVAGAPDVGFGD